MRRHWWCRDYLHLTAALEVGRSHALNARDKENEGLSPKTGTYLLYSALERPQLVVGQIRPPPFLTRSTPDAGKTGCDRSKAWLEVPVLQSLIDFCYALNPGYNLSRRKRTILSGQNHVVKAEVSCLPTYWSAFEQLKWCEGEASAAPSSTNGAVGIVDAAAAAKHSAGIITKLEPWSLNLIRRATPLEEKDHIPYRVHPRKIDGCSILSLRLLSRAPPPSSCAPGARDRNPADPGHELSKNGAWGPRARCHICHCGRGSEP